MLVFFVAGNFASAPAPDTPSQRTPMLPDFFRAEPARIPKERRSQPLCWKRRFCLLNLLLMLNRRTDEIAEQRMRTVRTGFEFRMRLGCNVERMIRKLDHLDNSSIW